MLATKAIVFQAYETVRPAAEALINTPSANWGPRWLEARAKVPGVSEVVPALFGQVTNWDPAWGPPKDFDHIANRKLQLVEREKLSLSEIVFLKPWLIRDGELLYSGGNHRDGISVVCSGIKGRADEGIANLVIDTIQTLFLLEADRRRESKDFAQEQMFSLCTFCTSGRQTVMGLDSQCAFCKGNYRDYGLLTDEQLDELYKPKQF